eukprot:5555693-Prymnesium_polylepis.1
MSLGARCFGEIFPKICQVTCQVTGQIARNMFRPSLWTLLPLVFSLPAKGASSTRNLDPFYAIHVWRFYSLVPEKTRDGYFTNRTPSGRTFILYGGVAGDVTSPAPTLPNGVGRSCLTFEAELIPVSACRDVLRFSRSCHSRSQSQR